MLISCFTATGFVLAFRLEPEPSAPQTDTVELTAFSHSALDIKTYAMALLKTHYRETTKRTMPRRWFDEFPHTHVALDDAIEQGALFCNMLQENSQK